MNIYFKNQSQKFNQHLARLRQQEVRVYNKAKLIEKVSTIAINTNRVLYELNTDFFWRYQFFPSDIMSYYAEWFAEQRGMQVGDTIVQQAFIPPIKAVALKLVFGVRIKEIIQEQLRVGYSYETLNGYVEMGISTFTIEQIEPGNTVFKIHTFSKPGNFLTKLVGPIFSLPYQAYCTQRCLKHVKTQLEQ